MLKRILEGKKFAGLEIIGPEQFRLLFFEKKGAQLHIAQELEVSGWVNLKDLKSVAVFLAVNDSNVIAKEVAGGQGQSDEQLLYKAFSNIRIEEFYYDIAKIGSSSLISICRKSHVSEILSKAKEHAISLFGISVGIGSFPSIAGFVDEEEILFGNYLLSPRAESKILNQNAVASPKIYNVNGLDIASRMLLPAAMVIGHFANVAPQVGNIRELNNDLEQSFYQNTFFKKTLFSFSIFVFSLLLVNFLVFVHYFDKANELSAVMQANAQQLTKIEQLRSSVSEKRERLKKINGASTQYSRIGSDITNRLPSSILLQDMIFQPLKNGRIEKDTIEIVPHQIIIRGETFEPDQVSYWIGRISEIRSVKSVSITAFGNGEDTKTNFELNVMLSDDL